MALALQPRRRSSRGCALPLLPTRFLSLRFFCSSCCSTSTRTLVRDDHARVRVGVVMMVVVL